MPRSSPTRGTNYHAPVHAPRCTRQERAELTGEKQPLHFPGEFEVCLISSAYVQIKRQSTAVVSNLFLLYPCDTTSAVVIKHSTRVDFLVLVARTQPRTKKTRTVSRRLVATSNLPPTSIMHNLLCRTPTTPSHTSPPKPSARRIWPCGGVHLS